MKFWRFGEGKNFSPNNLINISGQDRLFLCEFQELFVGIYKNYRRVKKSQRTVNVLVFLGECLMDNFQEENGRHDLLTWTVSVSYRNKPNFVLNSRSNALKSPVITLRLYPTALKAKLVAKTISVKDKRNRNVDSLAVFALLSRNCDAFFRQHITNDGI